MVQPLIDVDTLLREVHTMHPDIHLIVYRQQERELEARLARALAVQERGARSARRPFRSRAWSRVVERWRARTWTAKAPGAAVAQACCAA